MGLSSTSLWVLFLGRVQRLPTWAMQCVLTRSCTSGVKASSQYGDKNAVCASGRGLSMGALSRLSDGA